MSSQSKKSRKFWDAKNATPLCFNFLMNGIVRASIHIYNYKQASVHKTDEVVRSCQDQLRQSLETNPT